MVTRMVKTNLTRHRRRRRSSREQRDANDCKWPQIFNQERRRCERPQETVRKLAAGLWRVPNGLGFQYMEGATKWDHHIFLETRNAGSSTSYIELQLKEARARIEELVDEKRSRRNKIEQFLKKVSEERAVWRSKEHEKVRPIIDNMKDEMNEEKKTRERLETVNQNLADELADVKRYMHDYEKERKGRELIEELCDELAKELEEGKAEIEALKGESMNMREEVDDERRMLQMAEVWREERVQMKLVDAKVTLEEKYSQMNNLVGDLEAFLSSRNATIGVKRDAELLRENAASVGNVQDDLFMLFEEMNLGDTHDRETEQYVAYSPVINKGRHPNTFTDQNGEFDKDDDSGWETESYSEEHGSSYSPDESIHRNSNNHHHDSNVSMNGPEFQKTIPRERKEVCSVPRRQAKKVSSMAKLWSSLEGINGRVSNARKSTVGIVSRERDGFNTLDLVGQWSSSPDSANGNVSRGGMKGCIEWPRGARKNSFKTKLIEAKLESQKVQLKHVLEHKI